MRPASRPTRQPTLHPYLITLMCVQDDTAMRGLVQRYVGLRGTTMFNGWLGMMSPGKRVPHHDMVACLNVERIQNWRRNAATEFAFDIVFTAPNSARAINGRPSCTASRTEPGWSPDPRGPLTLPMVKTAD